jgi:hypothetical protein
MVIPINFQRYCEALFAGIVQIEKFDLKPEDKSILQTKIYNIFQGYTLSNYEHLYELIKLQIFPKDFNPETKEDCPNLDFICNAAFYLLKLNLEKSDSLPYVINNMLRTTNTENIFSQVWIELIRKCGSISIELGKPLSKDDSNKPLFLIFILSKLISEEPLIAFEKSDNFAESQETVNGLLKKIKEKSRMEPDTVNNTRQKYIEIKQSFLPAGLPYDVDGFYQLLRHCFFARQSLSYPEINSCLTLQGYCHYQM